MSQETGCRCGAAGRLAGAAVSLAAALAFAAPASALEVVYDKRTPAESREWADRNYIREQMEFLAAKICTALYEGQGRESLHENTTITLYLAPTKGGNPAFASGRRITWKVGPNPGGDGSGGMGLLTHEMTHVLDMGTDRVFTEAMADWVRNYKVWYHRCSNPPYVLDLRYKALRGGRNYGKYVPGANFIDFMTQNYGEGTIYRILQGYRKHGGGHWEKTFGKSFDGLLAEWRQMETIYDPVFQWTYNGTAAGKVRNDKKFCGLGRISAADAQDKSGAWLDGATSGKVGRVSDGSMAIALHGRFPGGAPVAVASLGVAREGEGKAVLLATGQRRDALFAHVVATLRGRPCAVVSTTQISVPGLASSAHSIVLSTRGGDAAEVVVDGRPPVKVDMKAKCGGCAFSPAFAVGGMSGGLGVPGISEPRGENGVLLDDVRVFTRAFRARETADYAKTFGANYRPAVAVTARWCGGQGGTELDDPSKWFCVNSLGEKIVALPTKDTDVVVSGRAIPSIPKKARFECKSFTIDGWAVADAANIDLRGVKEVEATDNARIITKDGHSLAVGVLKGRRVRLDGALAAVAAIDLSGGLEMKGGSVLRLPAKPEMAHAKSISVAGEGEAVLMPGENPRRGVFAKMMKLDEMPSDLSRFRLKKGQDANAATFRRSTSGGFLGVTTRE